MKHDTGAVTKLDVTQADRELFIYLLGFDAVPSEKQFHHIIAGKFDGWEKMQRIARHRLTHSLPGDGRREALASAVLRALYGADIDPFAEPEKWDFAEKVARAALGETP